MIEVEVDGHEYDEMHADSGTVTQVFFYGNVVDFKAARESAKAAGSPTAATGGRVYVIRNAQVRPEREQVERSLVSITPRTLSTMVKAMAFSDLNRIYGKSWARGIDFNYVDVPDDLSGPRRPVIGHFCFFLAPICAPIRVTDTKRLSFWAISGNARCLCVPSPLYFTLNCCIFNTLLAYRSDFTIAAVMQGVGLGMARRMISHAGPAN
jgi:hypothetical protein